MSRGTGKHGSWASVEQRVTEVYGWLVAGVTTPQIHKLANDEAHAWNVSPRTVRTYIAKARERLKAAAEIRADEEMGKAIARIEAIHRRAMLRTTRPDKEGKTRSDPDLRTALASVQTIIDLLGLKVGKGIDAAELLAVLEDEIVRKRRKVAELEAHYALPSAPDADGQ